MTNPIPTPRTPAPYDVLSSRQALLEAAKLNRDAIEYLEAGHTTQAADVSWVALSLANYALALDRWSP